MHFSRKWIFWLLVGALFFWFLSAIKAVLLPFVVGILVAYFLDPAADKLEAWGASRAAATTIIVLAFFGSAASLCVLLAPILYQQLVDFVQAIPSYIEQVRALAETHLGEVMALIENGIENGKAKAAAASSDVSSGVVASIGKISAGILQSGVAIANMVSLIVITPVVSFYLLRDWDRLVAEFDSLLPRDYADTIREQLQIIDLTISGFLRGTINVMIILAAFYIIGLSAVGLQYAILIGLLGGLMIIIPYLGTAISGLAAVGVAYLQFDTIEPVAIVFAIFVAGQMLEGYVLTPRLVGEKVGLHPVWLIFGMLAGASLFGFVGIFIAVPVTAVIGVLVRFAIKQYEQSDYYLAGSDETPS
ncbi:MAG: AI-2E family transporter [Rickettsiales bacterium]|nr:AI-2E family transporter [Rickettsiales bacterium]